MNILPPSLYSFEVRFENFESYPPENDTNRKDDTALSSGGSRISPTRGDPKWDRAYLLFGQMFVKNCMKNMYRGR